MSAGTSGPSTSCVRQMLAHSLSSCTPGPRSSPHTLLRLESSSECAPWFCCREQVPLKLYSEISLSLSLSPPHTHTQSSQSPPSTRFTGWTFPALPQVLALSTFQLFGCFPAPDPIPVGRQPCIHSPLPSTNAPEGLQWGRPSGGPTGGPRAKPDRAPTLGSSWSRGDTTQIEASTLNAKTAERARGKSRKPEGGTA